MRPVAARPRRLLATFLAFLWALTYGASCSSVTPVADEPSTPEEDQVVEQETLEEPLTAEELAHQTRLECIDGEYQSCCQIMSGEQSGFYEMDADFAESYLRSPCRAEDRSVEACTYLGVATHLQSGGEGTAGHNILRVGCYGGDRDACQWLDHLGVELRGVPINTGEDALGSEDFARGCLFRD